MVGAEKTDLNDLHDHKIRLRRFVSRQDSQDKQDLKNLVDFVDQNGMQKKQNDPHV